MNYSNIIKEFEEIHKVSLKDNIVFVSGIASGKSENKSYKYIHSNVAKEVKKRVSYFVGIEGNL